MWDRMRQCLVDLYISANAFIISQNLHPTLRRIPRLTEHLPLRVLPPIIVERRLIRHIDQCIHTALHFYIKLELCIR